MSASTRAASERSTGIYRRGGKRLFDVAAALLLLIVLLPVILAVALLVLLAMGRPVLFRQRRPGRAGRPFICLKFRTMREPSRNGTQQSDRQRLTPFGALLRRTSLDELPELWNVVRGEMSLVGPRPLLMRYLERYSPRQARRHEVRPGITGWAQINGRNALTWEEKLEHDVWYVDQLSPAIDAKILLMTLATVVRGRGVSAADHATMPEFRGSRE